MIDFLTRWEFWLALGLGLIVAEMAVGGGYMLLAFGLGGSLNALLLVIGLLPPVFHHSLLANAAFVATVSFGLLVVLRRYFNSEERDINRY